MSANILFRPILRQTWGVGLAGALCVGLAGGAEAQQRAMTPEDVLAMRGVSDPQIAPDGQRVVYVVSQPDLKANASNTDLWLVGTAAAPAIKLTNSPKSDNAPRWAPDSKRIAFLSAREERAQIWIISPNGGEAERLTNHKTAVSEFVWSPDGTRIAFVAEREPTAEEERRKKDRDDARVVDQDFSYTRLWIVSLADHKETEVVSGEFQVSDPEWSPDGTRISFTTTPTPRTDDDGRSDIQILTLATGKTTRLLQHPGPDESAKWSPDSRQIAFRMGSPDRVAIGQGKLVVISALGGPPIEVAPGFQYRPTPLGWSPDGSTIYFTAGVRTTSQLFAVAAKGGSPIPLTSVEGILSGVTFARSGLAAFTLTDPTHPAEVHISKGFQPFQPVRLTETNPQVAELALARHEVVRWKGSDGREIEGILYYPTNYQAGRRYPTIAMIHGGPSGVWTRSFPASWGNYAHVWAAKGWLVFQPNIRGSSGYGEEFLLSNVRDWGGGDYRDIQTGLDDLVRRGLADPARMGQTGWSYGGYMTAWTLTQTDRFKAVMVGAGLTNMYSMYSTNDLQTTLEEYFGGEPWDSLDAYTRASAMTYIKQARTPTLIMHGEQDTRVPIGQAQELYMGLRKNGVPATLVLYPRQGHGIGEPRLQLDKMQREYAFFAKWVLGEETKPAAPAIP